MSLEPLKPFSSLLAQDSSQPATGSTQLALNLSLLALESKPLALGIFARVALFPTQVDFQVN